MNLSELVTPALILDRRKLEANISRLHERMKALGVDLRPHGKTAKNIDVIRMALAGQSGGITVSTLKEAEYYFANGITDIVYAVGIAPVKLDRICALIKKGAEITVILDSTAQVRFVAEKARGQNLEIPVLVELDCDGHRSGVTLDDSLLLEIGRLAEREEGVTEVRAGVFVFYDLAMAGLGVCKPGDIAVSVLASVIGHQKKKTWTITDAGWMALSRDRGTASQEVDQGSGLVCNLDGTPVGELIVSSVNQEHGIIGSRAGTATDGERFEVGDMVRILPNHACATAAMHDRYYVVDGGIEVIDTWHRTNGW